MAKIRRGRKKQREESDTKIGKGRNGEVEETEKDTRKCEGWIITEEAK